MTKLELVGEDPSFLTPQLIAYIGNKRSMLGPIRAALETVQRRTGRDRLRIWDAFSGSGAVSRMLKQYSSELVVNDLEDYARVISDCYLTNHSDVSIDTVREAAERLNQAASSHRVLRPGFFDAFTLRQTQMSYTRTTVYFTPRRMPIASMLIGSCSRLRIQKSKRC